MVGKDPGHARDHDWLVATALVARDHIVDRWVDATRRTYRDGRKRVYYFSLEFLIGRLLFDALGNLGITDIARAALRGLEVDLDRLRALEPDAALGNGGLGRLAACFMESMATLGIPAHGYGIRYDHGIFRQVLRDGWQLELPEDWLSSGNPWEFERPEVAYTIGFGGTVEGIESDDGTTHYRWEPAETVNAVAFDTPITGWRGRHVNTLRLWSARATDPLRLDDFNRGDHVGALADRVRLEAISRVLYPSDDTAAGHELRLRTGVLLRVRIAADLLRRHKQQHGELVSLADHVSIQLNDTHPAIAVPELMRLLVDEHGMPWELAWTTTTSIFNYTNHTLLPEALETWQVSLIEHLLPRHMQIIYLINALHLDAQRNAGHDDDAFLSSVSMIEENHSAARADGSSRVPRLAPRQRRVRPAHRPDAPDGVPRPERDLSRPDREQDQRDLLSTVALPGESRIDEAHRRGRGPRGGRRRKPAEGPRGVRRRRVVPRALRRRAPRKQGRARPPRRERLGFGLDPDALFDVHIKRIHEYKRQLLNVLETIALYNSDARTADTGVGAAGEDLLRARRRRIPAREAHHQARLRRRPGDQPRPCGARTGSRSSSCPTTT
jgi:starch phosphorylase